MGGGDINYFYPSTWYICDFFLFHIEIERKCGWIIGGPKGMLAPLSNYWWGAVPPPLPPPPLPTPIYLSTSQKPPRIYLSTSQKPPRTPVRTNFRVPPSCSCEFPMRLIACTKKQRLRPVCASTQRLVCVKDILILRNLWKTNKSDQTARCS